MSAREVAASHSDVVTIIGGTNHNNTIIEFSDFENARTKLPPTVTGTVYETEMLPEDARTTNRFNRHDSFRVGDLKHRDNIVEHLRGVDNCLKKKVTKILQKNPWLASKIVYSRRVLGRYAMEFQTELTEEEAEKQALKVVRVVTTIAAGSVGYFGSRVFGLKSTTQRELAASSAPSAMDLIIADPITENTYEEIVEAVRPLLHKSTARAVGEDRSLWDVLLIPLTEKTTSFRSQKFLLVHSLNSCMADPATLYKVYGMLSAGMLVERLDPTRYENNELKNIKHKILGGDPNFMRSSAIQAGITKRNAQRLLDSTAFSNQTSVWKVDDNRIETIKARHKQKWGIEENEIKCVMNDEDKELLSLTPEPRVPFVSTNDILTSWFLSQNKDASIGCLLADLRRKSEIPDCMVGNYQGEIVYNTRSKVHDAKTPAWIRASIERDDELLKRYADANLPRLKKIPGMIISKSGDTLLNEGATIVSNWTGLCKSLSLEHDGGFLLKPEAHLPLLLDAHHGLHSSIGWNKMVVFQYTEDDIGVVITAPLSATNKGRPHIPLEHPALFAS